ncbi:unnamed protein product [Amoebophrya sp. A120]|nr:unnamed protein product [Amoebophrya sp. A120]|eukprot:GSA120T00011201001.1
MTSSPKKKSGLCCVGGGDDTAAANAAPEGSNIPPQLMSQRSQSHEANPFAAKCLKELPGTKKYYFSLPALNDPRIASLPYSIRILLESAVRNCDGFEVKTADVENILNWKTTSKDQQEVPFKPARVLLQDFTGVPAVVDFAAMRDAMARLGGDPDKINPLVPADLVIDHSVQVDVSRDASALEKNQEIEFMRNKERFAFLKWGAQAFQNMTIVPPGSGIVHQVNLEYLARVVFENEYSTLYPDSLVGTDSHTTMIDGLGIAGWGVGGIEAEAVMLGQAISMVLPEVVGFKLTGTLKPTVVATDLVITCVAMLRKLGVVGKFVEFFGDGCANLTLADRATIANMAPEYGATMGFFPVDEQAMIYLRQTGRSEEKIKLVEQYLRAQGLFREYGEGKEDPVEYTQILELDLSTVVPCVSGPKRPHDRVALSDMPSDFTKCLTAPVGFKGFGLGDAVLSDTSSFTYSGNGEEFELSHGSVVLAAITSCTNTSNPGVMLGAGLLAKAAHLKGLRVKPYVKTSLSPGSGVVDQYLRKADLLPYFEQLGFYTTGFGCQSCIGNSGDLDEEVADAITKKDLVVGAVLSGNRNFEGRVHPLTRANYLASPPLVVAYALAGKLQIDFEKEPLGKDKDGNDCFLADIWPSKELVEETEKKCVQPEMFTEVYAKMKQGTDRWNNLEVATGSQFAWDEASTYIHNPPFFKSTLVDPTPIVKLEKAYCLLNCGDSITTDHISPAGKITKNSPGGRYLISKGVDPKDFNSYGSRRGNDEVMARGTFANIRLVNKLAGKVGPQTLHVPSGEILDVYDAAEKYMQEGFGTIIMAGNEYGSGSSRDWAAKGPFLQGVKAVIAQSYERIHRSNLVGMGILPLQFKKGESAETLGFTGKEQFTIDLPAALKDCGMDIEVLCETTGTKFTVVSRLDTAPELKYFQHGGILNYVLRKIL